MAATNLPYPAMDFVPLDILTADELDHMVANIDAINNALIAPQYYTAKNGNQVTTSNSYPSCASTTVAVAGTYLIVAGSQIEATSADYFIGDIRVGSASQQQEGIYLSASGQRSVIALAAVATVSAGQTIYYRVGSNSANGKSTNNYIHAVRIA